MLRMITIILTALVLFSSVNAQHKPKNVAIFIYDGVDILDIGATGEILSNVMVSDANKYISKAFDVYLVSLDNKNCTAKDFITLKPNYTIYESPKPDVIIVPGGKIEPLLSSFKFMKWLQYAGENSDIIMGIGSGVYAIAAAGLLDGKQATVWDNTIDLFHKTYPDVDIIRNVNYFVSDNVITTAGSANSIDAALHIVLKLVGPESANAAARYINYKPWLDSSVKLDAK